MLLRGGSFDRLRNLSALAAFLPLISHRHRMRASCYSRAFPPLGGESSRSRDKFRGKCDLAGDEAKAQARSAESDFDENRRRNLLLAPARDRNKTVSLDPRYFPRRLQPRVRARGTMKRERERERDRLFSSSSGRTEESSGYPWIVTSDARFNEPVKLSRAFSRMIKERACCNDRALLPGISSSSPPPLLAFPWPRALLLLLARVPSRFAARCRFARESNGP